MDLVSIIVPAYNVEKYLERCLDSICAQSYRNLEIIVIDDGSTDGTGSVCDRYADKDNRFRIVHKDNGGVAAARNTALDIAGGDMIAFADADDYMEPDMIGKLYEALTGNNADLSVCGYYEEYTDKTDEHRTEGGTVIYDKVGAYKEFFKMGGSLGSGCWNKMFRAEVLKTIRYKDYVLGEDIEMICRSLNNCERIANIDYTGYHYIHRGDSATRLKFGEDNLNVLTIANEIVGFIRNNHPELIAEAYAFNAAWHSAQIQVMYWQKDTAGFTYEKEFIKKSVESNMNGYIHNPYISKMDMIFIRSFMQNKYAIVKKLYDIWSGIRLA